MHHSQPAAQFRPSSTSRPLIATICGLAIGIAASGAILYGNGGQLASPLTVSARECPAEAGPSVQRIGDRSVPIRAEGGERWFCADNEALDAGWRAAGN